MRKKKKDHTETCNYRQPERGADIIHVKTQKTEEEGGGSTGKREDGRGHPLITTRTAPPMLRLRRACKCDGMKGSWVQTLDIQTKMGQYTCWALSCDMKTVRKRDTWTDRQKPNTKEHLPSTRPFTV